MTFGSKIYRSVLYFVFQFEKQKNFQVVTSPTWTLQVLRARRVMLELGGERNFPTSVAFVIICFFVTPVCAILIRVNQNRKFF